jgi:threonine synthase
MRYVSTRGGAEPVTFRAALAAGIAPDGGLYVPEHWPEPVSLERWQELGGEGVAALATELLAPFVGDEIGRGELEALLGDALAFPFPVRRLSDRIDVLELFHGPTLAFKDTGARVMARLAARLDAGDGRPLTVLVATSGDTGGAVASAFHGVPGTRVVVLFPKGQVSPRQERQMTTLGGNVTALAVRGTFDDCQRLVKAAFADPELSQRHRLTSANSINLGRLLPQMVYHAVGALTHAEPGSDRLVCVPSGNFGNLCAGLWAKRLGLPIAGFVAATNANDVVPEWFASGHFAPRASVATIANAMDVGHPSNVERIRWTYCDDLAAIRRDVVHTESFDDEAIRGAIVRAHRDHGAVLCPHTACGLLALERALVERPTARGLLLATAHPAKFAEVVESLIGEQPLPAALAAALEKQSLAVEIGADLSALAGAIDGSWLRD